MVSGAIGIVKVPVFVLVYILYHNIYINNVDFRRLSKSRQAPGSKEFTIMTVFKRPKTVIIVKLLTELWVYNDTILKSSLAFSQQKLKAHSPNERWMVAQLIPIKTRILRGRILGMVLSTRQNFTLMGGSRYIFHLAVCLHVHLLSEG